MILRALVVRPTLASPLRFLVTLAGVAAGVGALCATLAASRAALASLREGVVEVAGASRLEVRGPAGVDEALLGALRPVSGDARILPVVEQPVLVPAIDDVVRLLGVDLLAEAGGRGVELAGPGAGDAELLARALRGEGAFVPRDLASALGLAAGDALEVEVGGRRAPLEVLGVFEEPSAGSAWARVVVVDVALAQELLHRVGRLDRVELAPRPGVDERELAAAVARLLPRGARVAEPERRARETAGMVRSLEFNLTALSGISLVVAGVLVATTLATAVVQRRKTISLLRSLGASERGIASALLAEAAAIGVLGSALGVAGGLLGARLLLDGMRATVTTVVGESPASPIRAEWDVVLVGFGVGLAAALAASLLPVLEARATPPIQGLRGERPEVLDARSRGILLGIAALCGAAAVELSLAPPVGGLPVMALAASLLLFAALFALASPLVDALGRVRSRSVAALPLRLAAAALAAGRRRAAWAAGAVGIAVALAVSIASLTTSFRTTVVDWTARGLAAELALRPAAPQGGVPVGRLDPSLPARLEAEFGPGVVDPYHSAPAWYRDQRITFGGAEFAVVGPRGGVPLAHGFDAGDGALDAREVFAAAHARGTALVNEAFARRFELGVGDEVELEVHGGRIVRAIEGVFADYGDSQGALVVDRSDFLAHSPDEGPREIALFLPRGTDVEDARRRVERVLGGARASVSVVDRATARAQVLEVFDRTFAITRSLQGIAAAVAVVAVLSVLYALVAERRADLGLLSALGASRLQIGLQVCLQSGLLGLVGAGLGGLVGLAVGLVLVEVVNLQSFGWSLEFRQPWASLAATGAAVSIACLAAGLFPAAAAARAGIREAIRDE